MFGQQDEQADNAQKINDIPGIDHAPAQGIIMGIDTQRFDEQVHIPKYVQWINKLKTYVEKSA